MSTVVKGTVRGVDLGDGKQGLMGWRKAEEKCRRNATSGSGCWLEKEEKKVLERIWMFSGKFE